MASAVAVPRTVAPSEIVTTLPWAAVPVSVGFALLVMPSELLMPESVAGVKPKITGVAVEGTGGGPLPPPPLPPPPLLPPPEEAMGAGVGSGAGVGTGSTEGGVTVVGGNTAGGNTGVTTGVGVLTVTTGTGTVVD